MKLWLLFLAVLPLAADPHYTVVNIGGVGGSLSEAFAINAGGSAAGRAYDALGRSQGFAYENVAQYFETGSDARGINASGDIAGTLNGKATVWRNGEAESLGSLGGQESYGLAINDLGYATGGAQRSDGGMHAFLSFNGHMVDAGTLGGTWSAGYGINNSGQIAGVSTIANGQMSGFRWDAATGTMEQLKGTAGSADTRAYAINARGAAAGTTRTSRGYYHAAMWDTDGVVLDLGSLGGHSFAYGMDDRGLVVGFSYDTLGRQRAFVWTGGTLFDLNTLVDADGWSLTAAYGVNSSGQIVGTGYYNGVSSAFRLDPIVLSPQADFGSEVPEPMTAVPVLIGLAGILCTRKR